MNFSAEDKLEAIHREIGLRKRVYPRLLASETMTQERAKHEIAVMEAIAADYEALAQKERLL